MSKVVILYIIGGGYLMPEKTFDDFIALLNDLNWSQINQSIYAQLKFDGEHTDLADFAVRVTKCETMITTTILREYHYWLINQEKQG
jgi:hypothetical protein